jgi:hypothetical protein
MRRIKLHEEKHDARPEILEEKKKRKIVGPEKSLEARRKTCLEIMSIITRSSSSVKITEI